MNILIAGAGGFIAGHLVKSLGLQGHNITAVDIKDETQWFQLNNLKNVTNIGRLDLRDKQTVASLISQKNTAEYITWLAIWEAWDLYRIIILTAWRVSTYRLISLQL